ncbi:zinc finger MYM-type protein 1-like [Aphis craccivora]|uniref:Zinc finger MYM-type protein 1-like n=1 Tax=Aphis craccivora TaxID=307492 RepID=A0A6G0WD80_APHCR|nr:zinc finger MYM-type protein 1-like [Aphis craccivora]
MKQERLNALIVLTVEQEMAVNIDVDAVIDDFKTASYTKLPIGKLKFLYAPPANHRYRNGLQRCQS